MFNGIKGSDLLIRNGILGMGIGGVVDYFFFDHLLLAGFGMLIGALGTYIYLAKKHGCKNLNR